MISNIDDKLPAWIRNPYACRPIFLKKFWVEDFPYYREAMSI